MSIVTKANLVSVAYQLTNCIITDLNKLLNWKAREEIFHPRIKWKNCVTIKRKSFVGDSGGVNFFTPKEPLCAPPIHFSLFFMQKTLEAQLVEQNWNKQYFHKLRTRWLQEQFLSWKSHCHNWEKKIPATLTINLGSLEGIYKRKFY